uniref:meiosis inhibitor protein 1-like n=1 Tax=Styela clava TaxID=7725 RepID=UPI001939BBD0|nr:meiosis inhibitor protein 1-like [Styela clava]
MTVKVGCEKSSQGNRYSFCFGAMSYYDTRILSLLFRNYYQRENMSYGKCRHGGTLSFCSRQTNKEHCISCILEYLEKDDNPMVKKITVIQNIEEILKNDVNAFIHCLSKNDGVIDHYCSTLIKFLHVAQDIELVDKIVKCTVIPIDAIGRDIGECILPHIISTSYSVQETNTLFPTLSLLHNIANISESVSGILLHREPFFVKFLLNATDYPDNLLRLSILKVCSQLVSMSTRQDSIDNPVLFRDALASLPKKLFSLLSSNDNADVLLQTLGLLSDASLAEDFLQWLCYAEEGSTPFYPQAIVNELLAGLKRILLKREERLTRKVIHCLIMFVGRHAESIIDSLLNADLAEFIYDTLRSSTSPTIISSIYCCILLLAESDTFHKDCHAMYGFESVLRSLQFLLKTTQSTTSAQGITLLRIILDRQPGHVCILKTLSLFDRTVEIIKDGLGDKHPDIVISSVETLSSFFKHFPPNFCMQEIKFLLKAMDDNVSPFVTILSGENREKPVQEMRDEDVELSPEKRSNSLGTSLRKIFVAVWNVLYRACELIADKISDLESNSNSYVPENQDQLKEVKSAVLDSIEESWLNHTTKSLGALSSPTVIHSILATIVVVNRSLQRSSFIHKLMTGVFIHLALTAKSRFYADPRHGELANLCGQFLYTLNIAALRESTGEVSQRLQTLLVTGFTEIRGKLSECVCLMDEMIDRNETILPAQCSVFAMIFNHYWHGGREFIPVAVLNEHLNRFIVMASSLNDLPKSTKQQIIFLFAICNANPSIEPNVPSLIVPLLKDQQLCVDHPIFVSFILRISSAETPIQQMQSVTLKKWLHVVKKNDDTVESTSALERLSFLIEISKVNRNVAAVIFRSLDFVIGEQVIADAILGVLRSIFNHYHSISLKESQEEHGSFCMSLMRKLSKYAYNQLSDGAVVSEKTLRMLLKLLILITSSKFSMDLEIWSYLLRIMKVLLNLVLADPCPQAAVVDLTLCFINFIFLNCKQENQIKSALTAAAAQKQFLRYLIFWAFGIPPACDANEQSFTSGKNSKFISSAIELLATLIEMHQKCHMPATETLVVPTTILNKVLISKENVTRSAVIRFWACVLEGHFMSDLVKVKHEETILSGSSEMCSKVFPIFRRLWNESLNMSTAQMPTVKKVAFRCAVALYSFAQLSQSEEFLGYLANHPWLDVVLLRNLKDIEKLDACRMHSWTKPYVELVTLRTEYQQLEAEETDAEDLNDGQDLEEMLLSPEQNSLLSEA